MKRYFKIIFLFLVIAVCISSGNLSYSQTLQFCEDVSKEGTPINASSVFSISAKGGSLKCLTTLPYSINTQTISYDIYKLDSDGNEIYDNTIYQDVETSWFWFWKEIIFYDEGRYNIIVYDGDKNFLTSSMIRIQYY